MFNKVHKMIEYQELGIIRKQETKQNFYLKVQSPHILNTVNTCGSSKKKRKKKQQQQKTAVELKKKSDERGKNDERN